MRVGLHGLRRHQRLGGAGGGVGHPVLALAAELAQAAAQHQNRHHHRRHRQQHQAGQLGAGQHQRRQPAEQDQHVAQRDRGGGADHALDHRGVGGQPRQHLAGLQPLIERGRQRDHPVIDGGAHVGDHPLAQPCDEIEPRGGGGGQRARHADQRDEILVHLIGLVGVEAQVDHPAQRQRQDQGEGRRQHQKRQRRDHGGAVRAQERPQRAQRPNRFRLRARLRVIAHGAPRGCRILRSHINRNGGAAILRGPPWRRRRLI